MINKFKLKRNFFKESEFSNNVFTLFSGTLIAQVIPISISPLLTRLYTPENFGIFAFLIGLTMILTSVLNGRYDASILLPKKDTEAFLLFQIAMYLPIVITIIVYIVLWFLPQEMMSLFGLKEKEQYLLYIVPILAISFTFFMAFDFLLNRNKAYKKMSKLVILRVLFVSLLQVVLGLFFKDGLLYGLVIGMVFALVFGVIFIYPYTKNIGTSLKLKQMAQKYKNYPMYHMPHTFFNALSNNVPMLLLPYFFSLSVTGFYMMALKVFYTPFSMLGSSIEKVFRKQIVDTLHEGNEIASQVQSMLYKVVGVSLIPFIVLVWWAPQIFSFLLGEIWYEVGIYVQILSLWIYMTFIVSIFIGIPIVLGQQKKSLMIESIYFVFRIIGLVIGAAFYQDIYIALAMYTLGGTVVVGYNLFWIYRLAQETKVGRES